MVLLRSCCCWQSVRHGSLASGIYTMAFYSVIVTAGSFHLHTIVGLPEPVPVLLIFSILMLAFAALSVIASVILIVGLCTNNRMLLMPWIICVTMTTILDVILSFYLVSDSDMDPFFGVLVATDYFICALNVYCILCVTSQYQEYTRGGNRPRQDPEGPPAIHFEAASTARPNQSPARMAPISVIQNNGSPTSSICRPLLPAGDTRKGRSAKPSNLFTSSSPVLMLSRSSFSSTSEISFCSSDVLSSSRRSSALPSQDVPKQGLSPVGEVNTFPSPSTEDPDAVQEIQDTEDNLQQESAAEDSKLSETSQKNEASLRTSRFRLSGVLSSMKSAQKMANINIVHGEEQSAEDKPNEKLHESI